MSNFPFVGIGRRGGLAVAPSGCLAPTTSNLDHVLRRPSVCGRAYGWVKRKRQFVMATAPGAWRPAKLTRVHVDHADWERIQALGFGSMKVGVIRAAILRAAKANPISENSVTW